MESSWNYSGMVEALSHLQIRERSLSMGMQSLGWEHYEVHEPEPHILLFK